MPEYRIRETGEIVTDLKRRFPNISLPLVLTEADYELIGVDPILQSPQPLSTQFQTVYRSGIEEIDGKWFVQWGVSDWSEEAVMKAVEDQWARVRDQRNKLLAECDWTMLNDSPLTEEVKEGWAVYRQALRDITLQNDPFEIEWPTKPA